MAPVGGSSYCFAHDPNRAADRLNARSKGGHNRRTTNLAAPSEIRLRTTGDVLAILENAVGATFVQENSAQRSRTLGYLLGVALGAIRDGEFEARIAALEERFAGSRVAGRHVA